MGICDDVPNFFVGLPAELCPGVRDDGRGGVLHHLRAKVRDSGEGEILHTYVRRFPRN